MAVEVGRYRHGITTSDLSAEEKVQLSDHLKDSHPDTARQMFYLLKDPQVQEILGVFGGGVWIPEELVPTSLRRYVK